MRDAWVAQSVVSNFGSGRDLTIREFKPRVELCADSSEPGACFGFCHHRSLPLSHSCCVSVSLCLFLSLKKKILKKFNITLNLVD